MPAFLLLCASLAAAVVNPPDPPPTFPPTVGGAWGPVMAWPHIPIAMANLPDGRILTYASNEPNSWPYSPADEYTHAAVWNPATGAIKLVPHPGHDMFCAALVTIESGETFVMGGRYAAGSPWVSYYDFQADRWVKFGPDADMNRGRWYPTAVYLGSGQIFIAVGLDGGANPELWTPGVGWKLLTGIDLTQSILAFGTGEGAQLWPLMLLNPDGSVFHYGATPRMNRIDPFGGPAGLGGMTDLGPNGFDWFPDEGVSVLYDAGKILVAGGSRFQGALDSSSKARRIDLMGPAPVITPTGSMNYPRQFMNEVLLPTGEVLVVGGSTTGTIFSDDFAVRNAEIWSPESDTWRLLNPQDQARTYHSTAVLLVDGTVLSGGGGLSPVGQACDGLGAPGECGFDHWNAEIFTPPYLFAPDGSPASRPTIASAPAVARVGRTIRVQATPGLSGFSLIRMSATTHTMNTDQRFLRPAMVEVAPGTYDLSLHPNENVLVPGYWMLFAMGGQVPSVAKVIQIVNDGMPRGPRIDGMYNEVGDSVLYPVELEDPDGNPLEIHASGLPPGLTISPTTGVIQGELTTPGLYNVSVLALDGTDAVNVDFQWVVSIERSEFGLLSPTPSGWTTVNLDNSYEHPVVVLGPPTFHESDPTTVRVRNVTSTSFEYRVDEWPYLDRAHTAESVAYLVVEAGEYKLANGRTLLAGTAPGVDFENPQSVSFPAGAFSQTPTVLAQVASASVAPVAPPTTARVAQASIAGFRVELRTQEAASPSIPAEEVHWIAVEPGGVSGLLETALSPDPVDETPVHVAFSEGFSGGPLVFATLQSTLDDDPVTLRLQDSSSAAFDLFAQEETSSDAEVDHGPEAFGWLAIDPAAPTLGLLPLWNEAPTLAPVLDQASDRGASASIALQALDPEGSPLAFSATGLPPGLAIGPSTGVIAGIPLVAGTFTVRATATDASGAGDSVDFLWSIREPLTLIPSPTPPAAQGSALDYQAQTSIQGSFEYQWDFGDGSPPSGVRTTPQISHLFPGAGRYVVTLSVDDPATGQSDLHQFVQMIVPAPTPSAPSASSSILYEAGRDRVWVTAPDGDAVAVIDATSRTKIAEIPVADGPETLARAGDGRIWVASKRAAAIEIIDPNTLAVVQSIPLQPGSDPHGLVFEPSGRFAFVALEAAGRIVRLDGSTGALLGEQLVGRHVRHLSVSADGATLYAPRFVSPPLPNEASGQPLTESAGNAVGGEVLRLDASTLALLGTTILPVSQTPDSDRAGRGVPNYLGAAAISPDGTRALVPSKQDNVYRGGFRDGRPLGHDSTMRAIASRIDLTTGLAAVADRLDFDNAGLANATVYAGLGAYALTTLEGNRQLAISDPRSQLELGRVDTGRAPRGIALSPDGRTAYVDNFMDRSVSIFDLSRLIDHDDAVLAPVATVSSLSTEALAPDVLAGKQLFYDSADPRLARERYVYCAACHHEGGQDGRVWDFTQNGEGLRSTIDLRGHGVGHGRLHWTANFDEVQDFEGQIRSFGGSGLLADADFLASQDPLGAPKAGRSADLDALAAYVASLTTTGPSPARANDGSFTPEAQRGRALFGDRACGSCHRGAPFTDSASTILHDVGTSKPSSGPQTAFDTPTLRGLWRTTPYLHDGSAPSLAAAVATHAGAGLTAGELVDLAAYLEQIDDAELAAPNSRPIVSMTRPLAGSSVTAGVAVELVATASDAENGDLTSRIEWRSDADGLLGTGGSLSLTTLSLGPHTLTASVADDEGLSDSASVAITIHENAAPTVVIQSPADGSSFAEGVPVELRATASDPEDGDLGASLVWVSNLDGPLGTGASLSRGDLSLGAHTITASVVDSLGLPDSAVLMLTIAVDAAPTVTIASPLEGASAFEGTPVSLVATASDAEEGDLTASIAWSSSRDGALGSGGTLSPATLTPGTHTLTASVADSLAARASAQVALTIESNAAPVVTITSPAAASTATEGTLVSLAATASDAEDGDLTASIAWSSSIDGPLGTGGSLALATLTLGTHTLTASVTDSHGRQHAASVSLTIAPNATPVVAITSPASGASATHGMAVLLAATAHDAEDGDVTSGIEWRSDADGLLGTGGSLSVTTLSLGTHTITASVVDSLGASGSAQTTLVVAPNATPTVTITAPVDGSSVTRGVTVNLVAAATDPEDGSLAASIRWVSDLDGPLGTGASLSRSDLSLGTHTITASVVDSLGVPDSAVLTLTIVPDAAPTVTIASPLEGSTAFESMPVSLVATASDAEDGDLTASIAWSSSLDGALGTGGSSSVTTLTPGLHTLTASVTDSLAANGSAQVTLTIESNAAPTITITSPAAASTATEGTLVTLAATASDAEDGDLTASIAWSSSLDGSLGSGGSLGLTTLTLGSHMLTASVVDSHGRERAASVAITIAPNAAPAVAVSSPVAGSTATQGTTVVLAATASDAEDGDLSASISWSSNLDGPLGTGASLSRSDLSLGTHTIIASVVDSLGRSGSTVHTFKIVPNAAPTVTIASPADGFVVTETDLVVLTATATDLEDGDLTSSIAWTSDLEGPLGTGGSLGLTTLTLGTHTLTASVTDSLGLPDSAVLTLTIVPNAAPTVTITSPASSPVEITQIDPIALAATATDPEDGDLGASVLWTSSLDGALGTGTPLVVSQLSLGLHAISASVTDRHGSTRAAQVEVHVPEPGLAAGIGSGVLSLAGLAWARRRRSPRRQRSLGFP